MSAKTVCINLTMPYEGFKTINKAVAFLIAAEAYLNCKEIPVYDSNHVNRATSYGHLCQVVCSASRVNDNDSDMSDDEF